MSELPRQKRLIQVRRFSAGFTIIELVIVIALLGIISGALSLNYAGITRRQNVKQEALNLKQLMRVVQTKAKSGERGTCPAVTQLYGWRVAFANPSGANPASITYQPACPTAADLRLPDTTVNLKDGISFDPLPAAMMFRPLNLPVDNAGSVNITNGEYDCSVSVAVNGEISDTGCVL